jgi:hypothetical protein
VRRQSGLTKRAAGKRDSAPVSIPRARPVPPAHECSPCLCKTPQGMQLAKKLMRHPFGYSVLGLFLGACVAWVISRVLDGRAAKFGEAPGMLPLLIALCLSFGLVPLWAFPFDSGFLLGAAFIAEPVFGWCAYRLNRRSNRSPEAALLIAVLSVAAVFGSLNILAFALSPETFAD